jgi:hypothetical protein
MSDYFTEIEAHFSARRGTPFLLNAKDWALMKKWHDDGVPLPVVIEAIDTVFEKAAERKKIVNSIHYCKHAVKELWDERRELAVGEGSTTPEESPAAGLDILASELDASPNAVIRGYASRVRELAREKSVPRVEEALIALERELLDAVLASLTDEERESIRAEIARAVGDTSRLKEKTRARTEEANLRRIVRDRFELPRLTLFR